MTEQLTGAELQEQLDKLGDVVLADGQDTASFRELIEAAGTELKRRFDSEPGSLPGTFVIKLFLDGQKALTAKEFEPDKADVGQVSILDRIDALPAEHAIALVKGEIARLDSLRADYFAALERIEKGAK